MRCPGLRTAPMLSATATGVLAKMTLGPSIVSG
jgi:hypothetical protein